MNTVPKEYQINNVINHNEYLINGQINNWDGKQTQVYSTLLCSNNDDQANCLLEIHLKCQGIML